MKFTDPERDLLRALQRDGAASLAELGERVGMAASTVWRKVQEFERAGLVRRRVALLDPGKAGAKLCIFASVRLSDHSEAAVGAFAAIVARHPEIMEAHAISGTSDYILKIRCADVESYEAFMSHNLLRSAHVRSVVSSFSLKELKYTTELPL
jgi:Lrp/AsnC family transcriptional regulator